MKSAGLVAIAALAATLMGSEPAEAHPFLFGGRYYFDPHPYHNGYFFVPPSSAYEEVRLRPPFWFGVPAYYIPQSYLAPGTDYYPPAWYPTYPNIPAWRAGGNYMSARGAASAYPW